jgi:hypothetical protein
MPDTTALPVGKPVDLPDVPRGQLSSGLVWFRDRTGLVHYVVNTPRHVTATGGEHARTA